jgi:hypothetical protein
MLEINNRQERCSICRYEYTSTHVEAVSGVKVYVCKNCLETAKNNFIWICMNCGRVYIMPKDLVIKRINDIELKRAYLLCRDMRIIQGIDMCIECDPEGIMEYLNAQNIWSEC